MRWSSVGGACLGSLVLALSLGGCLPLAGRPAEPPAAVALPRPPAAIPTSIPTPTAEPEPARQLIARLSWLDEFGGRTLVFETDAGEIKIRRVAGDLLMLKFGESIVHVNPQGDADEYADLPKADQIWITDPAPEHLDLRTIRQVTTESTRLILDTESAGVLQGLTEYFTLREGMPILADGILLEAVPAYIAKMLPAGAELNVSNSYLASFGSFRLLIASRAHLLPELSPKGPVDVALLVLDEAQRAQPGPGGLGRRSSGPAGGAAVPVPAGCPGGAGRLAGRERCCGVAAGFAFNLGSAAQRLLPGPRIGAGGGDLDGVGAGAQPGGQPAAGGNRPGSAAAGSADPAADGHAAGAQQLQWDHPAAADQLGGERWRGTSGDVGDALAGDRHPSGHPAHVRHRGGYAEQVVGRFIFHPEHSHWHLDGFSLYELWSVNPDGTLDQVLATSGKVSFCLRDIRRSRQPVVAASAAFASCGARRQGISAGWIDTYQYYLPGQTIDVTGLPDGRYALMSTADPFNLIRESEEGNNFALVYLNLEGGRVQVLDEPSAFGYGGG